MLKRPIPSTSSTAPMVKVSSSALEKSNQGSSANKYTIKVMGSAESSASHIFDRN